MNRCGRRVDRSVDNWGELGRTSMASWAEMARERPEMEARARELFLIEQPDAPGPAGLGYLATVRADGGPRVHPVSPAVVDGRLYVYCLLSSPKLRDLRVTAATRSTAGRSRSRTTGSTTRSST
jgi:hypothetical protein